MPGRQGLPVEAGRRGDGREVSGSGSASRQCINQGRNNGNKNANGRPKQTVAWMWPPRGGIIQWLHLPGRAVQQGEAGSRELNLNLGCFIQQDLKSLAKQMKLSGDKEVPKGSRR